MRDLKKLVEGNVHPSKGFGFVTFSRHEDALHALRNVNNNPNIFTSEKVARLANYSQLPVHNFH